MSEERIRYLIVWFDEYTHKNESRLRYGKEDTLKLIRYLIYKHKRVKHTILRFSITIN